MLFKFSINVAITLYETVEFFMRVLKKKLIIKLYRNINKVDEVDGAVHPHLANESY